MDLLEVDLQKAALDLKLELVAHISDFSKKVLHRPWNNPSLFFISWLASLEIRRDFTSIVKVLPLEVCP